MWNYLILFLLITLAACSTSEPERSPSSGTTNCKDAYLSLFGESFQLAQLEELESLFSKEITTNRKIASLEQLIEIDGLAENQRKNRIILAMLKRSSPDSQQDELITLYWKQFKRCP